MTNQPLGTSKNDCGFPFPILFALMNETKEDVTSDWPPSLSLDRVFGGPCIAWSRDPNIGLRSSLSVASSYLPSLSPSSLPISNLPRSSTQYKGVRYLHLQATLSEIAWTTKSDTSLHNRLSFGLALE